MPIDTHPIPHPTNFLLGLPKGRFESCTRTLLGSLGIVWKDRLCYRVPAWRATVLLLKASDIPRAVSEGHIDLAVTPEEWSLELDTQAPGTVVRVAKLPGWLPTRLSFFGQPGIAWPPIGRARVATCFPGVAVSLLHRLGVAADILHVTGSTEAFVGVLADYGFDCVETGMSLRRHGLIELHQAVPALGMDVIAAPESVKRVEGLVPTLMLAMGEATPA